MIGKKLATFAAFAALSANVQAQTSCITTQEAEIMVQALLPGLIGNVRTQCEAHLPANANLIARSEALQSRYAAAAEWARPHASEIALRMIASEGNASEEVANSGGLMLEFFEIGIASALADAMTAENCGIGDRVFTALEPLPSRNFAGLLTLLMEIGAANDDEPGPFRICEIQDS
jgi:hypothetical protein